MRILAMESCPDHRKVLVDLIASTDSKSSCVATSIWTARSILKRSREADDPFDIVLIDLDHSRAEALALIEHLRSVNDRSVIMATSLRDDESLQIEAFSHGADDFIVKPYSPDLLLVKWSALLRRNRGWGASSPRIGRLEYDPMRNRFSVEGEEVRLTPIEATILYKLFVRPNTVHNKMQLVASLAGGGISSLEMHISRLRKKLKEANVYIRSAYGDGYLLCSENERSCERV